jgi:hypothetical protein
MTEIKRRLKIVGFSFRYLAAHGRVVEDKTISLLSDEDREATPVKGKHLIDELAKMEKLPHLTFWHRVTALK